MPLTVIEHTLLVKSARSLVTVATELSSLSFVAYLLVWNKKVKLRNYNVLCVCVILSVCACPWLFLKSVKFSLLQWIIPASCTMGTGSFPGVKSGRYVTLTPHHLLVPWSWEDRATPLPPYGPFGLYRASVPVQGCTLLFFTVNNKNVVDRRICELRIWLSEFRFRITQTISSRSKKKLSVPL
jgi:hypothetical protein